MSLFWLTTLVLGIPWQSRGLCASSAGCMGSIPGGGTRIAYTLWYGGKKNKGTAKQTKNDYSPA